ncbi:hypothetical protein PR202_gb00645 [Eleusine coracana subsp. coracana]|uniref:Small ribosomal subunit protein mS23 n=1 Tax=Eleusine coracana subsp. coracana TaxID=191504 RepID=A0AAV5DUL4_ELECO|nr:hypothetical protein PR202_gb00645 [Eleusine coracana subsp. coracana]
MSYMRGDLLTKTRKLVKGLAKPAPTWLKAMEEAPPVTFPRTDGKIKKIEMPEDVYVKRFSVDWLMEYRTEKKAKKKAYKELKEIARSEGKTPPPNPYPSAIKEIQAEEKKYVDERRNNPKIIEIAEKMKQERDALFEDRRASGQW